MGGYDDLALKQRTVPMMCWGLTLKVPISCVEDQCLKLEGAHCKSRGMKNGLLDLPFLVDTGLKASEDTKPLNPELCKRYNEFRQAITAGYGEQTFSCLEDVFKWVRSMCALHQAKDPSACLELLALKSIGGPAGQERLKTLFLAEMPAMRKEKELADVVAGLKRVAAGNVWSWVSSSVKVQGEAFVNLMESCSNGKVPTAGQFQTSAFVNSLSPSCEFFFQCETTEAPEGGGSAVVGFAKGRDAYRLHLDDIKAHLNEGTRTFTRRDLSKFFVFAPLYGTPDTNALLTDITDTVDAKVKAGVAGTDVSPGMGSSVPFAPVTTKKAPKPKREPHSSDKGPNKKKPKASLGGATSSTNPKGSTMMVDSDFEN